MSISGQYFSISPPRRHAGSNPRATDSTELHRAAAVLRRERLFGEGLAVRLLLVVDPAHADTRGLDGFHGHRRPAASQPHHVAHLDLLLVHHRLPASDPPPRRP